MRIDSTVREAIVAEGDAFAEPLDDQKSTTAVAMPEIARRISSTAPTAMRVSWPLPTTSLPWFNRSGVWELTVSGRVGGRKNQWHHRRSAPIARTLDRSCVMWFRRWATS
jgi:hypothetical protein